jgi:hypothetical protein
MQKAHSQEWLCYFKDSTKGLMVRFEAHNRLWKSEKIGGDWPKGQRKFFVETRQEKLHIQK